MTEYEYLAICKGREMKEGVINNHFRTLAFITWNLQVSKKDRLKNPADLWPIPMIDGSPKVETEEERARNYEQFVTVKKMFERFDKKKK